MWTIEDRFFEKVSGGDYTECWTWTASLDRHGYGQFTVGPRVARRLVRAHRWAWEFFNGPVPDGLVLDHLCRNRACVNPWHVEPVSFHENLRRGTPSPTMINAAKTHCRYGHEFSDENTFRHQGNGRRCKTCARAYDRERYRRKTGLSPIGGGTCG